MAKFQYISEGHTLVRTQKTKQDKQKVVYWEIIEIEDGIYSEARLMLAGFQKVIDGLDEVVDAAVNIAKEITGIGDDEKPEETEEKKDEIEVKVEEDGEKDITLEVKDDEKPEETEEKPAKIAPKKKK